MNEQTILKYANTEGGKHLLSTLTDSKEIEGKITKITPNSYHILKDIKNGKLIMEAHFLSANHVLPKILEPLTMMDIAKERGYNAFLHHAGLKHSPKYSHVFLATSTFNSNSGGDGSVRYYGNAGSTTFTQCREGTATSNTLLDTNANTIITQCTWSTEPNKYLGRGFFPFDTSSLPGAASISQTGTKLRLYVTQVQNSQSTSACLVQTTQSDPTDLVLGDFGNITLNSPDEGMSRVAYSGLSTSAYNDFGDFNANGTSWISKTGYTKLGLRDEIDVDNTGYPPSSNNSNNINGNFSESASNKPELVVAYTLSGGNVMFFDGSIAIG